MSIDSSALDLLREGGTSFKFDTIGKVCKGTVVSAEGRQQTDYATKKPKTYDDGKPMMELVITLQTDERDPDNADDDGKRRLYARGEMLKAIRTATGGKMEEGGTLAVKYTGDGTPKQAGFNAPKLFQAEYKSPAITVPESTDSLL